MGSAVIPFLNMRAKANEENSELRVQGRKQKAKQSVQGSLSENSFFSLLNALGLLGSGVLAALCASTKKEKAASDATIESEKEDAITSPEKKIEAELSNEKEVRIKALAKANEEQQSLVNRLKLVNDTITNLGSELQKEKRLVEDLTTRVNDLAVSLHKVRDERTELQEQLKEKLDSLSVMQEKINLLSSEIEDKEHNLRYLDAVLKEYVDFKSLTEKNFTSDAKILGETEAKLHLLEEQLKFSPDEVRKNEALASDLIREKDDLKEMLNMKLKSAKNLDRELEIVRDILENLRDEASDVAKQLQQLRNLCSELEAEVSKFQAEINETRESLRKKIDEGKKNFEICNVRRR